jgi:GAF domain-containing protein
MKPAPIPPDDAERLQALHRLLILDTPPEERFDRIVAFAAQEFDTSMAQLTLIDRHRQWAKARVGLSSCEMSRAHSFCGHLVELHDGLIVEDAGADERFRDNPIVTDGLCVRFYAGAPLIVPSGHVVGALCVLDRAPRSFDATDRAILHTLRDLALNELLAGNVDAAA